MDSYCPPISESVDIQCEIEISGNFYWSPWGNQAVAAANVMGFGTGEQRKERRGDEKCTKWEPFVWLEGLKAIRAHQLNPEQLPPSTKCKLHLLWPGEPQENPLTIQFISRGVSSTGCADTATCWHNASATPQCMMWTPDIAVLLQKPALSWFWEVY
ncbi:hypothetical protein Q8A73_011402 [Channa argus]|nr:hypothetical protein Q8A73_011402 [Channa argus]